jgi:hypothetical protein
MLKFTKADDRKKAAKDKITMCIFGPAGAGKTTQARTLDPKKTLFIDFEAGTLALGKDWGKDNIFDVRGVAGTVGCHPWELARAAALYIGGADPSDAAGSYSKAMYDQVCGMFGDPKELDQYDTVFVDSITVAARECFKWSQTQPDAFSERNGKPDMRGAYGLLGREMMRWITHLQHCSKSIIMVGILDRQEDELKRVVWEPQIDGSKTGRELPGVFDEVLTLSSSLKAEDGSLYRAFVCREQNPYGFPAKDRSGCLDLIEEPNLAKVLAKIRAGKRVDSLVTTIPTTKTAE